MARLVTVRKKVADGSLQNFNRAAHLARLVTEEDGFFFDVCLMDFNRAAHLARLVTFQVTHTALTTTNFNRAAHLARLVTQAGPRCGAPGMRISIGPRTWRGW